MPNSIPRQSSGYTERYHNIHVVIKGSKDGGGGGGGRVSGRPYFLLDLVSILLPVSLIV